MKKVVIAALLINLMTISPGMCDLGDKLYFSINPTTIQDIVKIWGQPTKIIDLENEKKILIFKHENPDSLYRNRFFLVEDDRVVDGGINYSD